MNVDETQISEPLEPNPNLDSVASFSETPQTEPLTSDELDKDLWEEPQPSTDRTEEPETPELQFEEQPPESSDRIEEPAEISAESSPELSPVAIATDTDGGEDTPESPPDATADLERRVVQLQQQELALKLEIAQLQATRAQLLQEQLAETQSAMGRMMQEALNELEQRKHNLQITIEQLERRQERIRTEMRTTFAGVSQDLAIRVQGFKDYLSGSLQDLVNAVEQLELTPPEPEPAKVAKPPRNSDRPSNSAPSAPNFAEQPFQERTKHIRRLLDKYRTMPDYYGPAWQLRRTFEPVHAERLSNWFFTQGARGAVRTMGSRLQNILVASASISVLHSLYGDRLRTLVLANTPERLGEWRRGLQDCLGISRIDFGPDRGVVLFESPDALAQKADRLLKQRQMPLIVVDETENQINLSMLQFPLWLAFAPDPEVPTVL